MNIRAALESEAAVLSALAIRAKAHWGYSTEQLERWRTQLSVSPSDIRAKPVFVATVGEEVVGFCSLAPSQASWELDNLWVLPEFMHRGIGSALLAHALQTAARGGAGKVTVDADPNAAAFYLRSGATQTGVVPAPIPGQSERVRPQLAFENGRAT